MDAGIAVRDAPDGLKWLIDESSLRATLFRAHSDAHSAFAAYAFLNPWATIEINYPLKGKTEIGNKDACDLLKKVFRKTTMGY